MAHFSFFLSVFGQQKWIYGQIWPEPKGIPEDAAQGNSRGLRPYFSVQYGHYPVPDNDYALAFAVVVVLAIATVVVAAVASVAIVAGNCSSNWTEVVIGLKLAFNPRTYKICQWLCKIQYAKFRRLQ